MLSQHDMEDFMEIDAALVEQDETPPSLRNRPARSKAAPMPLTR